MIHPSQSSKRTLPTSKIKVFVTDLDGCMTDPFETPNWEAYSQIRALQLQSELDPSIPPMSICTGRPMPYAEAQAQFLGVRLPFVFESGGGFYDLKTNTLTWNPIVTDALTSDIEGIRSWAHNKIFPNFPGSMPEFAKFTDVGLIHRNKSVIDEIHALATKKISHDYPHFEVHKTDVSVNIVVKKGNKGEGLAYLSKMLKVNLAEIAYIGDSSGDIPGLERVGMAFAPINAHESVKKVVQIVTKNPSTAGVLEAYHWIIQHNLRV